MEARPSDRHVAALDGVRALAILEVFVFHAFASHRVYGRWALVHYGNLGVDAFFVLSGFLITLRLFALAEREDLSPFGRWRTFFSRRTARIFPLYYLTLALLPFVGPAIGMSILPEHWPWLATYTVNIPTALAGRWIGPGHFWSLCVEEQFYVLFPAFVLTGARRWLAPVWLVAAASAFVLRAALTSHPDAAAAAAVLPPLHFDSFGAGIAAAVCAREGRVAGVSARAFYVLGVAAGVVVLVIGLGRHPSPLQVAALPTALSFAVAGSLLALWSGRLRHVGAVLGAWPLAGLGRISYGIYIVHVFILAALWQSRAPWLPSTVLLRGLLALALSIVVALISWRLFERPIVDRVRRATSRRS
jgi:peptidoglycan/LPS O-acetylase OafA/YrhL